ncbi:MAG TPA: signal peptidase II [bacterium]|nr:signal peptidase II [bacterium]
MSAFSWRYRVLAVVATLVVVADQGVKRWVVHFFHGAEGARRTVIAGFFDLVLAHNPGAAWSMFADLKPDALRVAMFVGISVAASVVVVMFAHKARPEQKLLIWALALVLGGALGNLVDRVVFGTVVDFIEVYSYAGWLSHVPAFSCSPGWGCRFPAFNVADSAITVGTALLILSSLLPSAKLPQTSTPPTAPADPASSADSSSPAA